MTPDFGSAGDLATDPDTVLARLADRLDELHRAMAPAATLECDLGDELLSLGRHEVPGLALLLRHSAAAEGARADALARAEALVRSGRVRE